MFENYIYAEGREKYVKAPKFKGCLFCGIAKNDPKIPKKVLFKDKNFMVIMNLFPYNAGHIQIIPIRHVTDLDQLNKEEYARLFDLVRKSVRLLKKVIKPAGFNVGINMGGDVAGGSILHLHVHIVPRFPRDMGFIETTSSTKVIPGTIDGVFKKLKKHAKILEK